MNNELWKILKEMGTPNHLTCLLRNLHAGQEQQLQLGMEEQTGLKLGKICQSCILSPCLFNWYAEYIMRNDGLGESQTGIKNSRRDVNNLRYADEAILMAESE